MSIEGLTVGDTVLAKDLKVPAGSTVLLDDDALIINVTHAPTAAEVEEELAEAEAEVGIERDESDEELADAAEIEAAEAAEGEAADSDTGGDTSEDE